MKVLANFVFDKDVLPGQQMAVFWLCPHKVQRALSHVSFCKGTNPIMGASTFMT